MSTPSSIADKPIVSVQIKINVEAENDPYAPLIELYNQRVKEFIELKHDLIRYRCALNAKNKELENLSKWDESFLSLEFSGIHQKVDDFLGRVKAFQKFESEFSSRVELYAHVPRLALSEETICIQPNDAKKLELQFYELEWKNEDLQSRAQKIRGYAQVIWGQFHLLINHTYKTFKQRMERVKDGPSLVGKITDRIHRYTNDWFQRLNPFQSRDLSSLEQELDKQKSDEKESDALL